jgi:hypothetical protein
MYSKMLFAALACACAWPASAKDASDSENLAAELAALREQVARMQSAYESRIAMLEEKLKTASKPPAAESAETMPRPATAASPTGANAFNPEVSLVLQGAYKHRKNVEGRHIGGFVAANHHHDGDEHDHGGDRRGFTLDHSEIVLGANVDPYFRGQATVAVLDGEAELEEAWFQSTALGHGLGLKAGRFLSGIGYLNEQHQHQWDFYEQPLMYRALFGEHGYTHDGVQLKWVAPLETFLEFGAELGRGQNFPGTDRNGNGANSHALFAHVGGDLGASHSWRAGLSWLRTRARDRDQDHESETFGEIEGAFTGNSRIGLADFVYKWSPDGNPARRNFTFQAEYFQRRESGDLAVADEDGNALGEDRYRTRQSGFYLSGVYRFTPNWRAGLRYDRLYSGSQRFGDNPADIEIEHYRPQRFVAMVDYNWSEFSRLRLQFARDRAMPGIVDNQITLQYVMSLGSHGAHKF